MNQTIHKILGLIQLKQASCFFVNGPPGSGKSFLLERLSQQLPGQVSGMGNVFGPYIVTDTDLPWAGRPLLDSLWGGGYLTKNPSNCQVYDLANVWHWIEENTCFTQRQTFIVLVDLPHLSDGNSSSYCDFLSNVRSLEATWQSEQIRFCHILAGFWDSELVKAYAQDTGVSFPYTEGENYLQWQGVSPTELASLVDEQYPELERLPVIQSVLYEITDGNPALTKSVLSSLPDGILNFTNLIMAAKKVAERGDALLVQSTQHLDEKSKRLLGDLLVDQYLPSRLYTTHRNRLLASGLVKEESLGKEAHIRFRSWFYETVVRLHGHVIDVPQETTGKVRTDELIPSIRSLNQELYRLINDIETQARNFVIIQLSLRQDVNQPLLMGLNEALNKTGGCVIDAQQKAENWRNEARRNGVFNDLNPIIAYLSTRDLSNIIKELSNIYQVEEWSNIGQAIRDMADIRDAVMHNQLVDDAAIGHLYDLQIQIYSNLNQAKKNRDGCVTSKFQFT